MEKENVKEERHTADEEALLDFDLEDLELTDISELSEKAEKEEEIIELVDLINKGQALDSKAEEELGDILEEFSLQVETEAEGLSEEIPHVEETADGEETTFELDFSGISLDEEMKKGEEEAVVQPSETIEPAVDDFLENIHEDAPLDGIEIPLRSLEEASVDDRKEVEEIKEEEVPSALMEPEQKGATEKEDLPRLQELDESEPKGYASAFLHESTVAAADTAPMNEVRPESPSSSIESVAKEVPAISEEKIEAIITRVVQETVERVARETFTQVAERLITDTIEALKKSLESPVD